MKTRFLSRQQRLAQLMALAILLVTGASQATAQNQFTLGTLQPGQLLLNLSASEQEEVPQDTLNASLQFTVQGRDKAALQNDVNAAMQKALDILEGSDGVEYSTTLYQVYITEAGRATSRDIENPVWRAQQGVALSSMDSDALLELMGELQAGGLEVTSQYYSLSPERYEEVADRLMLTALAKLQSRAEEAAAGLGKSGAALVEVSLDGSPNFPMFRERAAMAFDSSAGMAPPVAAPGETQVSLTVSARAVLSP